MILLIDIGNTRIKWAWLEGETLHEQRAAPHAHWTAQTFTDSLLRTGGPADRVLISNVSGARMQETSHAAIVSAWRIEPQFVTSAAAAGGVRNAYAEPAKLGVDRWLALIGARKLEPGAVCVVSVGTAMTIDGLNADGRHCGGVIVPGPDLMVSSLLHSTSDIGERAQGGRATDAFFANNTLGAVRQGAQQALSALIERAVDTMQREIGQSPTLLLTGGGAPVVEAMIRHPRRVLPDLVLRGLAVLAREP